CDLLLVFAGFISLIVQFSKDNSLLLFCFIYVALFFSDFFILPHLQFIMQELFLNSFFLHFAARLLPSCLPKRRNLIYHRIRH
ncbi:hypothetical protein DQG23_26265, partial [Paenibacillus contaminans]